jgi:hypothetical protein
MNFSNLQPSKNFVDKTNYLNRPMRGPWIENSLTGYPPPPIPIELTPFERMLTQRLGFRSQDIVLMRRTGATPDQIMQGWNLEPFQN